MFDDDDDDDDDDRRHHVCMCLKRCYSGMFTEWLKLPSTTTFNVI